MKAMLDLTRESWIWYSITVLVTAARIISRSLTFGSVKKLQWDDWLMLGALCTYTTILVCINIVNTHDSNLLPPDYDYALLTPAEVKRREFGSKMILVVETCQCITIWAVKACLLIMYYRLTIALRENLVVKALAVYVAFGFIFMMSFYFGVWCRPFSNYWAVPTEKQCSAATNHLITNATFNLSSDIVMLVLAIQMFVRSKLPWKRKLILCGIFGLGGFVNLAAVLNKYYSFSQPFGDAWTFWYVRESSTALLVGNLPYTWTLLRRIFKLHAFDPNHSNPTEDPSRSSRTARSRHSLRSFLGRRRHHSVGSSIDGNKFMSDSPGTNTTIPNSKDRFQRLGSCGSKTPTNDFKKSDLPAEKDPYPLPSEDDDDYSREQISFGLGRADRELEEIMRQDDFSSDAHFEDPGGLLSNVEKAHTAPSRAS